MPLQTRLAGRYIILKNVGQGGMAAVYQAYDERSGMLVAIKEMSQDGLTSDELQEALDSFRFEATTLERLRHPNLPRVYDSFSEQARHYLVMEFIDGQTLEQRQQALSGGATGTGGKLAPLPQAEALDWARQLCDALAYLHMQRPPIIFRDLKPANVMVTSQGQVKLIDFGIARLFTPFRARDTQALGTPGFAPPEQYGKAQTDARADIYALGCTLYQLLTGYDPATTPFNLPPMNTLNPQIAPELQRAVERATRLNRDERYPSVSDFERDLAQATPTAARSAAQASAPGASQAGASTQAGAGPQTLATPHEIDFGRLVAGQRGTAAMTITGRGGAVRGRIASLSPWLMVSPETFDGPSTVVQLIAETSRTPQTGALQGSIQIIGDTRQLYVPVHVTITPAPAPSAARAAPPTSAATRYRPAAPAPQPARGAASATRARQAARQRAQSARRGVAPPTQLLLFTVAGALLAGGAFALEGWGMAALATRAYHSSAAARLAHLPAPLALALTLLVAALAALLAVGVSARGLDRLRWNGRQVTILLGALVGAALAARWGWLAPWQALPWLRLAALERTASTAAALLLVAPLLTGFGAALGALRPVSWAALGLISFVGRNLQGIVMLLFVAGGVVSGFLFMFNAVACFPLFGALIGGLLGWWIASVVNSFLRWMEGLRPQLRP